MPNSNASAERLWSKYNLEKTKLRNSLAFETIKSIIFSAQLASHIRERGKSFQFPDHVLISIINIKTWQPTPTYLIDQAETVVEKDHSYCINLKRKFLNDEEIYKNANSLAAR